LFINLYQSKTNLNYLETLKSLKGR